MSLASLLSAVAMLGLQAAPIDADRALQIFRESEALSKRDGGRLWGKPLYGPMILVDATSGYAVANMPDKEGKLQKSGDVFVGKLPPEVAPANTALTWSGVEWTMIMWPLPELPHARGRLAMHECYHRIQDDLGLPAGDVPISHLDGKDGRTWLRLEMRALAEALQLSGEERLKATKDALDFRAARTSACGSAAGEAERMLEINEGLAEYTGLILSGFGDPSLDSRTAVALEREQASTTFARSFAYATGPAYGRLMDGQRWDWRKGLVKSSSLSGMLQSKLKYSPNTDTAHLTKIANRYDGVFLMRQETERAEQMAVRLAGFRKKYAESPVLELPIGNDFGYSYDPNNVVAFPGVGQVLASAKVTCEWGVLEVTGGGVLLRRNDKGLITGVVVSAPPQTTGTTIAGDGWKLTLSPGWKLAPSTRPGDLKVTR